MTSFVIQQPAPVMDSRVSDQWGSGICDCCEDVSQCCFGFWCCPCFACITTRDYGQALCLPLLDAFCIIPPINLAMRVSMRHRYGITDTICHDCVYASCCTGCSWCQMAKEMKRRAIPITLISSTPRHLDTHL
ncbi:cornifelin homolog B-like isoform X2 [Clupea harengus]|uniref:Cornifelin homolog B-like isoform X2 n=1 Tax=Clupea harengus TaxID=7950 RepID=A0A6P3VZG7_CLUHA|nr:cornifelin homolog B-like isoform X2 [Clupea harengus]